MKYVYQDAKDQNKVGTFIYVAGDDDTTAYVDEKRTTPFKASELKDAFMKRAIIVSGSAEWILPTTLSVNENGTVSVGCLVDGGTLVIFTSVAD